MTRTTWLVVWSFGRLVVWLSGWLTERCSITPILSQILEKERAPTVNRPVTKHLLLLLRERKNFQCRLPLPTFFPKLSFTAFLSSSSSVHEILDRGRECFMFSITSFSGSGYGSVTGTDALCGLVGTSQGHYSSFQWQPQ